jgi:hypothetical protein
MKYFVHYNRDGKTALVAKKGFLGRILFRHIMCGPFFEESWRSVSDASEYDWESIEHVTEQVYMLNNPDAPKKTRDIDEFMSKYRFYAYPPKLNPPKPQPDYEI